MLELGMDKPKVPLDHFLFEYCDCCITAPSRKKTCVTSGVSERVTPRERGSSDGTTAVTFSTGKRSELGLAGRNRPSVWKLPGRQTYLLTILNPYTSTSRTAA